MTLLAEKAQEYLALRRSLGHKLHEHGRRLPSLVTYLEQTRQHDGDDRGSAGVGAGAWLRS